MNNQRTVIAILSAAGVAVVTGVVVWFNASEVPGPPGTLSYQGGPAIVVKIDPNYPVIVYQDGLHNITMRYKHDTNVYGDSILFVPPADTSPPNNVGFIRQRKSNSAIDAQPNNQPDTNIYSQALILP